MPDKGIFTYQEAVAECQKLETALADKADLDKNNQRGYDACACAWVKDGGQF